jgi:hypothetical protein
MATITVSYDGMKLVLSDNGQTNPGKSEQIHWHPGRGAKSVSDLKEKSASPVSKAKFWSNAHHQNGVNFKGTISSKAEGIREYDNTCNVGTNENRILITEDTKIQVNSR